MYYVVQYNTMDGIQTIIEYIVSSRNIVRESSIVSPTSIYIKKKFWNGKLSFLQHRPL